MQNLTNALQIAKCKHVVKYLLKSCSHTKNLSDISYSGARKSLKGSG